MEICVEPILYEQKSVFIQMLELYNYDFSEFSNDDINEYGYFFPRATSQVAACRHLAIDARALIM